MNHPDPIDIRPARRRDAPLLAEFFARVPSASGDAALSASRAALRNHVLAIRADEPACPVGRLLGTCLVAPAAGRCALLFPPRLIAWDDDLAAGLLRAAAALACRAGARFIQTRTDLPAVASASLLRRSSRFGCEGWKAGPDPASPLARALGRAGFDRLAVLVYLRRAVWPLDRHLLLPAGLRWCHYSPFRRRQFAQTIARTYEDSLDCPKMAGLRTVRQTIAAHRHTGRFSPRTWWIALDGREAVGISLLNNFQGRGELVYLGTVPEARRRGIGRALLCRAIRDTAEMGLPQMGLAVDADNVPAVRLYQSMGFKEIRRRLTWFIPADRLDSLNF